jgi:hypothetical protein
LTVGSPMDNFEYQNNQGTLFRYTINGDGSWGDRGKTGGGVWGRINPDLKVGWSVSQDRVYQVTGAPAEGSNRGAAYVRQWPGSPQAKGFIVEEDTTSGDLFGTAVALRWPFLAVGAPGHSSHGAAFLYEYNNGTGTWIKAANRLDPAGLGLSASSFGTSIALSNSKMLIIGCAGSAVVHIRTLSTLATPLPGTTPLPLSNGTDCSVGSARPDGGGPCTCNPGFGDTVNVFASLVCSGGSCACNSLSRAASGSISDGPSDYSNSANCA